MRDNITPFERGETYYGGRTIDTNALDGVNLEGRVVVFDDVELGDTGVKSDRGIKGGGKVVAMIVRNMSGITLYGKRLVTLDPASPGRVLGYADTFAEESYPIDEFLPSGGVPNGDLFYVVLKGLAMCVTPMDGDGFGSTTIAAGDALCSLTSSGASTATGTTAKAGRIAGFAIVASTTLAQTTADINFTRNWVAIAVSAKTSGQTNADILVDVKRGVAGWP